MVNKQKQAIREEKARRRRKRKEMNRKKKPISADRREELIAQGRIISRKPATAVTEWVEQQENRERKWVTSTVSGGLPGLGKRR